MGRRFRYGAWGVAATLAIVLLWADMPRLVSTSTYQPQLAASPATDGPIDTGANLDGMPAPPFTLTDQFGRRVSLSQFTGKVVLLAFIDSECTTICPLTTQNMMDAMRMLGSEAAKHVQLLGIDANPKAIAVADLKQYSVDHGMMYSWEFLTGSLSQLKSVWQDYHIYAQIVGGEIDHTPALYVIDPQGREQVLFMTPSQYAAVSPEASAVAQAITRFLPQAVRPRDLKTLRYHAPQLGPASTIQLPEVTATGLDGEITIGPGQPQIVVFFASWVPQIKMALGALSDYAQQTGHPRVVAVDVEPTEPDLRAVESTLAALPSLRLKVGVDQTGQVADAYQATDLLWLSLTDGKGKIIWSQDGWSSESSLEKNIANALGKANDANRP